MKPFDNLTELLEWLSEAYPERCGLLANEPPNTFLLSWSDDEALVAPVNGEWLKHDEPLVEYLLREIIEAEGLRWTVEFWKGGFDSPFYYVGRVINPFQGPVYANASSPVLALGSALREAKG